MAACSIRDDSRLDQRCVQHPDEWDEADDLIAWMGLTKRLQHLKTKAKKNGYTNIKKRPPIALPPAAPLSGVVIDPDISHLINQLVDQPTSTSKPLKVQQLVTWRPNDFENDQQSIISVNRTGESSSALGLGTETETPVTGKNF